MGTAHDSKEPRSGGAVVEDPGDARRLWDVVPYIVYTFDRVEQRTVYANQHVGTALGYSKEQVATFGEHALARLMHPEDFARLPELLARWDDVADGEVLETEHRMLHADGTYRWFLGRDTVLSRDAAGRVRKILGTSMDITERKELEQELSRAQTLEAVGRLAGGVAHDFNNLLTAILSNVALGHAALARGESPRNHLTEIDEIARNAAQLTRQLLAFARHQPTPSEPSSLDEEIRAAVPMLRRLIEEDVEIFCDLEAPGVHAAIERAQLAQVLLNLAINARDAMPHGGRLTFRTSLQSGLEPAGDIAGPHVLLSVQDTGIGMSPETLRRVFEPFFTTKSPGRGTGLGLSTLYGVVRQCGGHVAVHSALDLGTRFDVRLRLAESLAPPAELLPVSRPALPASPRRVLIVEDNPMLARVLTELFSLEGFEVHTAPDGEAALVKSRQEESFDLVLCDVVLPKLRGTDVAQTIVRESPRTVVILWSGYPGEPDIPEGLPRVRFVHKPLEAPHLLKVVEEMLSGR
jgi:two-component system cell cycle sensor histidine kinase/response regulator CckA